MPHDVRVVYNIADTLFEEERNERTNAQLVGRGLKYYDTRNRNLKEKRGVLAKQFCLLCLCHLLANNRKQKYPRTFISIDVRHFDVSISCRDD